MMRIKSRIRKFSEFNDDDNNMNKPAIPDISISEIQEADEMEVA